jgi:hypothetical protein
LRSYPEFYKEFVNPAKVRYALSIDFSEMKPAGSGCVSFRMVDLFGGKYEKNNMKTACDNVKAGLGP